MTAILKICLNVFFLFFMTKLIFSLAIIFETTRVKIFQFQTFDETRTFKSPKKYWLFDNQCLL